MHMNIWACLADELAQWDNDLSPARLWLRDDDAVEPTENLEKLITLSQSYRVPMVLAVIPHAVSQSLADRLQGLQQISIAVHGYSHTNHAPADQKKCELGLHRGKKTVLKELDAGRKKLAAMFGDQFVDMLVPPWNRIDRELVPELAEMGFESLSTFTWKDFAKTPGLSQLNTHVDIIDWKGSRGGRALDDLVNDLTEACKTARLQGGAPVGLLTHHLVHDGAAWDFLTQLFEFCDTHNNIEWCQAASLVDGSIL